MAFKAGTVDKFDEDSMARAIEKVFEIEMEKHFPQIHLPESMRIYWRILFVAVAQGVIRHIRDQVGESFRIDVGVRQVIGEVGVDDTTKPAMESRNPGRVRVRYLPGFDEMDYGSQGIEAAGDAIYWLDGEPAKFVQVNEDGNHIWCEGGTTVGEGGGTVVEVEYEGDLYEDE